MSAEVRAGLANGWKPNFHFREASSYREKNKTETNPKIGIRIGNANLQM
jgi:hypothetical protein